MTAALTLLAFALILLTSNFIPVVNDVPAHPKNPIEVVLDPPSSYSLLPIPMEK